MQLPFATASSVVAIVIAFLMSNSGAMTGVDAAIIPGRNFPRANAGSVEARYYRRHVYEDAPVLAREPEPAPQPEAATVFVERDAEGVVARTVTVVEYDASTFRRRHSREFRRRAIGN